MTISQRATEDVATTERLAQLLQAVEARDTFIAVAAHELRNPIMPIAGQIELLLSMIRAGTCSLSVVEERLVRVQRGVEHYIKRAVVLLDVSRLNSGKYRLQAASFDLAALLHEISGYFAAAAEHSGVTLRVTSPPCLPGIWDRLAIEQIVDNLVSNAIKYGGKGTVELSLTVQDEAVLIGIRDHGKGIAAEHRARIFERFERVVGNDEYRSGFGVGLWVVGQLVAAMNGTISVEDAPGGGALFTVRLPKAEEPLS